MENKAYETSSGSLEMVIGLNGDANGGVRDTPRPERVLSVPEEVEVRREKERVRDPIRFVRWIVARPKTWFCE